MFKAACFESNIHVGTLSALCVAGAVCVSVIHEQSGRRRLLLLPSRTITTPSLR